MLFNSLSFLVLFGCAFAIHQLPLKWNTRKLNLLIFSYLFYAAWYWPMVLLLVASTIFNWLVAARLNDLERAEAQKRWFYFGIVGNLSALFYYKYLGLATRLVCDLVAALGFAAQPPGWTTTITLPLAISFFTFHNLSYICDVYQKRIPVASSLLDYSLYIAFFPHLIAGPIVRASDFLPQCARHSEPLKLERVCSGVLLFIFGLFEKNVLADSVFAPTANLVFDHPYSWNSAAAWSGVMAFSGQIFFDFAGYTTCAIGIARCFGFQFPENFRSPYASVGFSDFWKRWHVTLSKWLRDYLYIPLGGNRCGDRRIYLNLIITMLLGGLWHGAAWNFVLWGGLHGLYLVIERMFLRLPAANPYSQGENIRSWCYSVLTFLLVSITWVFFRSKTTSESLAILGSMFGLLESGGVLRQMDLATVWVFVVLMLMCHWHTRERSLIEMIARRRWLTLAVATAGMLFAVLTAPRENESFIYFQF